MAITVRGTSVGGYTATKAANVAWPTGSTVGDLAILYLSEDVNGNPASKPNATGWKLIESGEKETTWQKVLTAADISTGYVPIIGYVYLLQVFAGASKVGRVTEGTGVTVKAGGAALFIGWNGVTPMTPAAEKLHATDVLNPTRGSNPNNAWFRSSETAAYLSWSSSANYEFTVELEPFAAPPTPVPLLPAVGQQVDPAVANVWTWAHQSTRAQAEFRLRIREVGTAPWYWVTAAGALTLTDTAVASQVQSATIAAAALTSGKTYEWQVATSDGGALSAYSAARQVVAATPPAVATITVTAAAGDLTPTIAWTATYGVGSQTGHEARIATSATSPDVGVVWASGVTSGAALSVDVPAQDWVNGQAQYAWVRVQQTGGLWSPWTRDDVTHAVSWTPPAAPTLTVTAGTPPTIVVSDIASGNVVEVEAQVAGGAWRTVATVTATGTTATVRDPLAAYGVVTTYRARRQADVSGVLMWSGYSTTETLTNTDDAAYFVGDDGTYVRVHLREDQQRTIAQGVTVSYGLDALRPRIDVTPTQGEAGAMTVVSLSLAEHLALLAWLEGRLVWTMRWSPERAAGASTMVDVASIRMAPAAPLAVGRLAQTTSQLRTLTIAWVEQ